MKPRFLLYIESSGIINCNTFSVVPSIIIENEKMCCSIDDSKVMLQSVCHFYDCHDCIQYLIMPQISTLLKLPFVQGGEE